METFSVQKMAKSPCSRNAQNEPPLINIAVTQILLTSSFQSSVSWKLRCKCFGTGAVCTVGVREMLCPAWRERLVLLVGALPSTLPVGTLWPGQVN